MKFYLPALVAIILATPSFAGNWFGSGPWAQGAYYPGQLDGKYAASVIQDPNDPNPTPVGGVIGFALQGGRPSYLDSTTTPPTTALTVDPRSNYYAIFFGGQVYTGTTIGFINFNSSTVSGTLVPLAGPPLLPVPPTQGGGFTGTVNNNKALFTFSGSGTLGSTPFLMSGIKTSDSSN